MAKQWNLYTPEARLERALARAKELDSIFNIRGKRVLELGCGMGDLSQLLAESYDCEVVGIDVMNHDNWKELQGIPNLNLRIGDIASKSLGFQENSFDRIISNMVFEHMIHPWSALQNCQNILRPDGKKYIRAWLYGNFRAHHLYRITDDPWIQFVYSPKEVCERYKLKEIPWSYWINRISYQQYLFYFRKLGFYVTHENIATFKTPLPEDTDDYTRKILDLYSRFDLMTEGFTVVLEFDKEHPKQPIIDPVYRLQK